MSGTIPVVVSNYLSGAVPGAAFVIHSDVPTDFSDYYVVGDGALFAVGNDLYVTDAALTAAVSASGEVVRIVDGGTLISGETLSGYATLASAISAKQSGILLVGYSSSGVRYSPATRIIVGIKDSILADNVGTGAGGALSDNGTTKLYGLTVANNTTANVGGAIRVEGGTTWIGKSLISGNSTTGSGKHGGAISTAGSSGLVIVDTVIHGNVSTEAGAGGIYGNGLLVVSGSTFSSNRASTHSGAISSNATGTFLVTGSTFKNNVADGAGYYGGALTLKGGTIGGPFSTETRAAPTAERSITAKAS